MYIYIYILLYSTSRLFSPPGPGDTDSETFSTQHLIGTDNTTTNTTTNNNNNNNTINMFNDTTGRESIEVGIFNEGSFKGYPLKLPMRSTKNTAFGGMSPETTLVLSLTSIDSRPVSIFISFIVSLNVSLFVVSLSSLLVVVLVLVLVLVLVVVVLLLLLLLLRLVLLL